MRANTRRRLDALKQQATAARIGIVPIVDITKWSAADQLAFATATEAEQDVMIERIEGIKPAVTPSGALPSVTMIIIAPHPAAP